MKVENDPADMAALQEDMRRRADIYRATGVLLDIDGNPIHKTDKETEKNESKPQRQERHADEEGAEGGGTQDG